VVVSPLHILVVFRVSCSTSTHHIVYDVDVEYLPLPLALFTGANKQEEIRVWDLRARSVVYELATGNNSATSLAWDSERNALYAATECFYFDRMGNDHGYRKARIENPTPYDDQKHWPKEAYHDESYFGYTFDAGDHTICECPLF
jgi:hypothetical protein